MSEWIKCSERLPENEQVVLAYDDDIFLLTFKQTTDGRHKKHGGYFYSSDDGEFFDEIKYWQPLPPPPKDE